MPSKLVEFSIYTLLWLVVTSCVASAALSAIGGAVEQRVKRDARAVAALLDSVASAALRGNGSEVRFQIPADLAVVVEVGGRTATVRLGALALDVRLSHEFEPAVLRPGVTVVARSARGAVALGVEDG